MIANPAAGGGSGRKRAERAASLLEEAGRRVDLRFTRRPGHGTDLAFRAVQEGAGLLIGCGGDGTIRELLPALAHGRTALGLIPAGTANDFARAFRIPRRPAGAVRVLLRGRPSPVDLGRAGGKYFCTVASFGFDAAVNHAVRTGQVPLSGTPGYLWAVFRQVARYPRPFVRLRGEFGEYEGRLLLAATGNTGWYGGGMKILPQADPQDGRLDLCIVGPVSASTVLRVLPRLFWGGHLAHPAVRMERSGWIEIDAPEPQFLYADGDYLGETPVRIEALPGALSLVLPAHRVR